jgi:hypothetical protein
MQNELFRHRSLRTVVKGVTPGVRLVVMPSSRARAAEFEVGSVLTKG